MNLNTEQQQVVDHEGHSLVVACPGSGKTRVIVIKIGQLLTKYRDARICAVTFTRDSANELRDRLIKDIGPSIVNERCRIGTFHSLAIRQLRLYDQLGKVAAPSEQAVFLRRAIASLSAPMTYEDAAQVIEKVKSSREEVPEAEHPLYLAYANLLRKAKVEDLYDVIKKSLTLMQQGVIKPYPVKHMLVDEFQDTDEIQLAWVLEHAKAGTNVTVVGDDDQSVYSFRHALGYQGMDRFRIATDAQLIALGTNYRCRSEVLSAAQCLITFNQERIDKALVAARGPGGTVNVIRATSRDGECEQIVSQILPHTIPLSGVMGFSKTTPPGRWAVLARNRRTLDLVEESLREAEIKYLRPPSESIWTRAPFVQFIGILKSIQTGEAHGITNLLHWIGISNEDLAMLEDLLPGPLWRLLDGELPELSGFSSEVAKVIKEFALQASGWRRSLRVGNYTLTLRAVSDFFASRINDPDQRELFERVAQSVERLRGSMVQRANALTMPPPQNEEKPSGVALMTMHGSKGLEFDHVWIVSAEAGVVPSPKNPVYDEERRLFYVAMTRARDHLYISSRITETASPFVTEAGFDPRAG